MNDIKPTRYLYYEYEIVILRFKDAKNTAFFERPSFSQISSY